MEDLFVLPPDLRKRYDKALIVNFGGQYVHLIARRLREVGVYTEIVGYDEIDEEVVKEYSPSLIVLSGGPSSVLEPGAPTIGRWILDMGIPVLGICYGHQLIAVLEGGRVEKGRGEYGRTTIRVLEPGDELFKGWGPEETAWMSHSDYVAEPPPGYRVLAVSGNNYVAAMKRRDGIVYGVQFHPEVRHTPKGRRLLENFSRRIAGVRRTWRPGDVLGLLVEEIRRRITSGRVLVAVSGGIDSTVTALIVKRAVGDRILPVFVDHGLLREGEREEVVAMLRGLGLSPLVVDASERFLSRLYGTRDCEERRRIIGEEFARVFKEIVDEAGDVEWLAQGTTYPDVIESGAVKGADIIKTHHNVGGLPSWLGLGLVEPLRYFYKDEVRRIGLALGVPEEIVWRHPYPGPGLAVRIIGEFTEEKLRIVRRASRIVEEELRKAGLYRRAWQAFAVVGNDKWVGVKGDARSHGYIVTVRIVESEDAMTADWMYLPRGVLDSISSRITGEIPEVTMVTYAVTSKPPSTIEPC